MYLYRYVIISGYLVCIACLRYDHVQVYVYSTCTYILYGTVHVQVQYYPKAKDRQEFELVLHQTAPV